VEAFGAVGQPVIGAPAHVQLREREQGHQVAAGWEIPGVGRSVAAAADQEASVGRLYPIIHNYTYLY
jgi:hypothetical protein